MIRPPSTARVGQRVDWVPHCKLRGSFVSSFTAVGHRSPPSVRNLVAVASGTAGIGSSTAAVNLTRALTSQGKRVGRVDIDVWRYSAPRIPWSMTLRSASSSSSHPCRSTALRSCRSACSSRRANWSPDERHRPANSPSNTSFELGICNQIATSDPARTAQPPIRALVPISGTGWAYGQKYLVDSDIAEGGFVDVLRWAVIANHRGASPKRCIDPVVL